VFMASRDHVTTYVPKVEATNDQIKRREPNHILSLRLGEHESTWHVGHQPWMMNME
jgi:hypothetical protein